MYDGHGSRTHRIANMTELKTIGTYATAAEAHIARLALEQVGIVVFIEDENQADGGGLGWPVDGVKLRVRADEVRLATETLRPHRDRE
jgi:hypothetical protein